jgi:hypothetical protein
VGEIIKEVRWFLVILFALSLPLLASFEAEGSQGPVVIEVVIERHLGRGIGNIPVILEVDFDGNVSRSVAQTNEDGVVVWTQIIEDQTEVRVHFETDTPAFRDLRDPEISVFRDGTKISSNRQALAQPGEVIKFVFTFEERVTPIPPAVIIPVTPTPVIIVVPTPVVVVPTPVVVVPVVTITPEPTPTPIPIGIPMEIRSFWEFITQNPWLAILLGLLFLLLLLALIFALAAALSPGSFARWPAAYALVVGHPTFWQWAAALMFILLVLILLLVFWPF